MSGSESGTFLDFPEAEPLDIITDYVLLSARYAA